MVTGSHGGPKLSCMFTWSYPSFLCVDWGAEVGIIGLIQLALVPMRELGLSGLGVGGGGACGLRASKVGGPTGACLVFRGLSCWEASVALCL